MGQADHKLDVALETIEQAILPNLSLLIDSALDYAALARPGVDAEVYADRLRSMARQIGDLTALVAAVSPQPAAVRERMSA